MNIQQIHTLNHRAVVPVFHGALKAKYPRSEGTNAKGPWSVQNLIMVDENGAEIKAAIWNHNEIQYPEGSSLVLSSYNGQKGQSGLYVEHDDYQGQVTVMLRGTATCIIEPYAGGAQQQPQQPQQQAQQPQQPAQHHQAPPAGHYNNPQEMQPAAGPDSGMQEQPYQGKTPSGQPQQAWQPEPHAPAANQQPQHWEAEGDGGNSQEVLEAKKNIVQIANLHILAAMAVDRIEAPLYHEVTGQQMSEPMRQGATASIFIKAERDGLVRRMPTKQFTSADFK